MAGSALLLVPAYLFVAAVYFFAVTEAYTDNGCDYFWATKFRSWAWATPSVAVFAYLAFVAKSRWLALVSILLAVFHLAMWLLVLPPFGGCTPDV